MAVRTLGCLLAAAAAARCNASDNAQTATGVDANVADIGNVVAEAGLVRDSAVVREAATLPEVATADAAPVRPCEASALLEAGVELDAASALAPEPGPSCANLPDNCGHTVSENCCTSLLVPGGSFCRSYDGVMYTDPSYPATVSTFWLDKYEVTAERFYNFLDAWNAGWRPAAGAGKHVHLNGGSGLANSAEPGFELGWDPAWASNVPNMAQCYLLSGTRAMGCVNWYEAYAFCIWDGGFLPSEAEWNYAAAGGAEQRVYPWSVPPSDVTLDQSYGVFCLSGASTLPDTCNGPMSVGWRPAGDGRWGHADLIGSVSEWTLDAFVSPYVAMCDNCSYLPTNPSLRVHRGGDVNTPPPAPMLSLSYRSSSDPNLRVPGLRCARSPQ